MDPFMDPLMDHFWTRLWTTADSQTFLTFLTVFKAGFDEKWLF